MPFTVGGGVPQLYTANSYGLHSSSVVAEMMKMLLEVLRDQLSSRVMDRLTSSSLNILLVVHQTKMRHFCWMKGKTSSEPTSCNTDFMLLLGKDQSENLKKNKSATTTDDLKTFETLFNFILEMLSTLDWQLVVMSWLLCELFGDQPSPTVLRLHRLLLFPAYSITHLPA